MALFFDEVWPREREEGKRHGSRMVCRHHRGDLRLLDHLGALVP
jgi:hypothetical protein